MNLFDKRLEKARVEGFSHALAEYFSCLKNIVNLDLGARPCRPWLWSDQRALPIVPPEYPSLAQRRGWEGTVMPRLHDLANGKPGEIQIRKSSGRQQLDDAALSAVKQWSFVPARQGDVAQDGWVSVPFDFKIH